MRFIVPTKVRYRVQLHQTLTSSFQVKNFLLSKNSKIAIIVKGQGRTSYVTNIQSRLDFHGSGADLRLQELCV